MPHPLMKSRRVRRDYSRKSFANPLFSSGRGGGASRWRGWLTLLAALGAFCGWIWFIAYSPAFRVTDIKIEGVKNLSEWEIRDTVNEALSGHRWFFLPQTSLLILPESAVTDALNTRYVLESLEVVKIPPHTLSIKLKESVSAVLIQMPDGGQALIGLDGMVTRLFSPAGALDAVPKLGPFRDESQAKPKPPAYPVLFDERSETLNLRQQAVLPEVVRASIGLPKDFASVFGGATTLDRMYLDGTRAQTIRAVTSEGWAIYLNAEDDLQAQLNDAQTILRTKIGPDHSNLDYIDVRFGDKVFFKLRS